MTLNEFKAWLDGFGRAIYDAPTIEQWKMIEEKLKEVQPELATIKYLPGYPPCNPMPLFTPYSMGTLTNTFTT